MFNISFRKFKISFSPTNILVNTLHIYICIISSDAPNTNLSMLCVYVGFSLVYAILE